MPTKKKTKTTEITVERTETSIIRKTKRLVMRWCVQCGEEVRMITPEEAASMNHVSTRTIFALIEAGKVHFTETAEGLVLVCTTSLFEKEIKR
jgi:hypothetical protein